MLSAAKLLLDRGADPNQQDVIGNTPLHLAACNNNIKMVNLLLKSGADVNAHDKSGRNPLQLAQSKLKLMQNSSSGIVDNSWKAEVVSVVEMIQTYFQMSGEMAQLDVFSSFSSRLQLHQTKQEVDMDLKDILASLSHLNLEPEGPK